MGVLTPLQKATVEAIISIFESGSIRGEYNRLSWIVGDPGHLTYGRIQTTLASGNLYLLIKAYCEAENAYFAAALRPYLERLLQKDPGLNLDREFRYLLIEAANDPTMRKEQDAFFDRVYFASALALAEAVSLSTPLGIAVVYDSKVHGSWGTIRDRTTSQLEGNAKKVGEKKWITTYVNLRQEWLAAHPVEMVRGTAYRMDAFKQLIFEGQWNLSPPFRCHGVTVTAEELQRSRVLTASADGHELPLLYLTDPYTTGAAVARVQKRLRISDDGIFGPETETAVKRFQRRNALKADGIVGPATYSALGIPLVAR